MSRIHAGNDFTCVIADGGRALCWGLNEEGQLGGGTSIFQTEPRAVAEGVEFLQLSTKAFGRHVCAVTTSGDAYCWGQNDFGEVGNGVTRYYTGPQPVSGSVRWASVTAGWRSSCGLSTDAEAFCWGRGEWGQLGDGLATLSSVPVPVAGGHRFQKVEVGSNNLVCGLTIEGMILCWGLDRTGSLGAPSNFTCTRSDGLQLACATTPQPIESDELFREVSVGSSFACGVTLSLSVLCWGRNDRGQLGRISTEVCSQGALREVACGRAPMSVSSPQRFVTVAAGPRHACAVTVEGDAYCWGRNSAGELGNGELRADRDSPTLVRGGVNFRAVSAGEQHSCGESTGGELYCWGSNAWGQLGTGDSYQWLEPARVVVAG